MRNFLKFFMREISRDVIVVVVAVVGIAVFAFAFTEPAVGPTGGSVNAPINTSGTAQRKTGSLSVGAGGAGTDDVTINTAGGVTAEGTVTGNILNALSSLSLAGTSGITKVVSQITGPLGAVTTNGANVTFDGAGVTQAGNTFTFTGGGGGITSVNGMTGPAISVAAGAGISVSNAANTVTITNTGGAGGGGWTDDGTTVRLTTSTDNVGIGTLSPSEKLDISGSVFVGGNWYKSGNLSAVNTGIGGWQGIGGVMVGFSDGLTVAMGRTSSGYTGIGVLSGVGTGRAAFYYNSTEGTTHVTSFGNTTNGLAFSTGLYRAINILNNGNMGVGTTNPSDKLHVAGGVMVDSDIRMNRSTRATIYPSGPSVPLNLDFQIRSAGTGVLQLNSDNGGNVSMVMGGGRVGIGVFPGYKLDVAGDVNASGCFRGPGGAYAGTCVSDELLKKNITSLSGSLEKITALNPVSFEFADSKYGAGLHDGLIAQEVEKIFPNWVTTGEDGYKRVRYGLELQMRLIGAVKEQQKEIESLKLDNAELKARIDALEKR